jgi:hypothetical protein
VTTFSYSSLLLEYCADNFLLVGPPQHVYIQYSTRPDRYVRWPLGLSDFSIVSSVELLNARCLDVQHDYLAIQKLRDNSGPWRSHSPSLEP